MNPIREAANRLPGAWFKGELTNDDGTKCCGLGHLVKVIGSSARSEYLDAWHLMDEVATEQFPERIPDETIFTPFPTFNDHPDTTEDEVISVMEKAAVRWDEKYAN